jgi:addiction module HigA family antidote
MGKKELHPVHPGEVLLEEFLKPMDLSQNRLALDIGVPPRRINEIVLGKRSISADTALGLGRYFGNSPQFWLGLQRDYDLDIAAEAPGERLEREVQVFATVRDPRVPYGVSSRRTAGSNRRSKSDR